MTLTPDLVLGVDLAAHSTQLSADLGREAMPGGRVEGCLSQLNQGPHNHMGWEGCKTGQHGRWGMREWTKRNKRGGVQIMQVSDQDIILNFIFAFTYVIQQTSSLEILKLLKWWCKYFSSNTQDAKIEATCNAGICVQIMVAFTIKPTIHGNYNQYTTNTQQIHESFWQQKVHTKCTHTPQSISPYRKTLAMEGQQYQENLP